MKNLKETGIKLETERRRLEKRINNGIKLYNEKNNEKYPLINIYNYNIKDVRYSFEENKLNLYWEEDISYGGYSDYEEREAFIPYEYFSNEINEEKIDEDKKRRDSIKLEIKDLREINEELSKEEKEHQKQLFAAKDIQKKYKSYICLKDIEKEIKKCESLRFLNIEKIKKLEGELK
jgi:hypothetical protein